jgi:arsenate reductase
MTEAIVNARLVENWQAFNAGTKPSGYVHPKAISALAEIEIQYEGDLKYTDKFRDVDFDLVVTVCDDAVENYPVWLVKSQPVHIGIPDLAKTNVMADFRKVQD